MLQNCPKAQAKGAAVWPIIAVNPACRSCAWPGAANFHFSEGLQGRPVLEGQVSFLYAFISERPLDGCSCSPVSQQPEYRSSNPSLMLLKGKTWVINWSRSKFFARKSVTSLSTSSLLLQPPKTCPFHMHPLKSSIRS